MSQELSSPEQLLEASYSQLGYEEGDILPAVSSPEGISSEDWLNKGEWLSLAKTINAEKIFFVDNNPVIVFAESEKESQHDRFKEIWNMARPPLLFLATPGELAVYDLTVGPARNEDDWNKTLSNRQLAKAEKISEVLEKLNKFRREQIETGYLFGDQRFGETERADRVLISDLKVVRDYLINSGLKVEYAHSLIGRSIFIRYLEDRNILTEKYFQKVTRGKPEWRTLLDTPLTGYFVGQDTSSRFYFRVLQNKEFTYALFERLAHDFNGDMFPDIEKEKEYVTSEHLNLIKDFLCGSAQGQQLFFFAYKFDIIPIELISSIYEEFYTAENGTGKNGTHYTPPALVEFLLHQVLTPESLQGNPRIYDIACGSGIFLVEAFRRIIRYRVHAQGGRRLSDVQLRKILREQLAGIDINEEAVRVVAFSLYLAFLHYQKKSDILEQIKQKKILPNLKYEKRKERDSKQHYDILLAANAFEVEAEISSNHEDVLSRFSKSCADIIVGNPPWGAPPKKDIEGRKNLEIALKWCEENNLPVGDKEWSQAFIHKTIDLLRKNGIAGLLVSSSVLFKSNKPSKLFRKHLLSKTKINSVVNFEHVREVFFRGSTRKTESISPFISIAFENVHNSDNKFKYWSAKKSVFITKNQIVNLSYNDLKYVSQDDIFYNYLLWKIYWWGGHRDEALINSLRTLTPLKGFVVKSTAFKKNDFGRGFGVTSKGEYIHQKCKELKDWGELPLEAFDSYGPLTRDLEEVMGKCDREGNTFLYDGLRLLVSRSIKQIGLKTDVPVCGYRLNAT